MKALDYIYHTGHLAVDRDERDAGGTLTGRASQVDDTAERLWRSYLAGKVVLYQVRRGEVFEYHCRAVRGA